MGRVDDLIREYAHVWGLRPGTTSVYACGHPQMIENALAFMDGKPVRVTNPEALKV